LFLEQSRFFERRISGFFNLMRLGLFRRSRKKPLGSFIQRARSEPEDPGNRIYPEVHSEHNGQQLALIRKNRLKIEIFKD
jgi:hypothetical protein